MHSEQQDQRVFAVRARFDENTVAHSGKRNGKRSYVVAEDGQAVSGLKRDFRVAQKFFQTFVYPQNSDFITGKPVSRKNISHYFIRIKGQ